MNTYLSAKYKVRSNNIAYLIRLIDKHGLEIIKRLEEENLYLKAELEYSKKLRAVVLARKNQQQKKK